MLQEWSRPVILTVPRLSGEFEESINDFVELSEVEKGGRRV